MPSNAYIHTSKFVDETALLNMEENPKGPSRFLQDHIIELERLLKLWRIKIKEQLLCGVEIHTHLLKLITRSEVSLNKMKIRTDITDQ